MKPISFICHWNKRHVLEKYLLPSLEVRTHDELILLKGYRSLSAGYAAGEKKAKHDLLVFVHQDIVTPPPWRSQLEWQLRLIGRRDPSWGLIGVFGAEWTMEEVRTITTYGNGWDYGRRWADHVETMPHRVHVLDSLVLIKRKGPPRFDPQVPTFHGAAEDLCLSMRAAQRGIWAANVFTKHYSTPRAGQRLQNEFVRCAAYLVDKWQTDIPSANPIWEVSLGMILDCSPKEVYRRLYETAHARFG